MKRQRHNERKILTVLSYHMLTVVLVLFSELTSANSQINTYYNAQNPTQQSNTKQTSPPMKPAVPNRPDCSFGFPGTWQWNNCWAKFHEEMAQFQNQIQAYGDKMRKEAEKNNSTSSSSSFYSYNNNFSSSPPFSTSTTAINGYVIRSSGISISTQMRNEFLTIIIGAGGPIDSFRTKLEGQEMELTIVSRNQNKIVNIHVPENVKLEDLKIERNSDTLFIKGPSGSSSGNYNTNNFNGGGAYSAPPMPMPYFPVPMIPPMQPFPPMFPFQFPNMWMN